MYCLVTTPPNLVNGSGTLSAAITWIQCQQFYNFLKAWKKRFKWCVSIQNFVAALIQNLSFFGFGPWAIIHGTAKLENTFISRISILIIPFKRSLSKLSEKHNNFDFRSTEFKLCAAERYPKSLIKRRGGGVSFNSHNLSTVDPMSKIFGFSESLWYHLKGLFLSFQKNLKFLDFLKA